MDQTQTIIGQLADDLSWLEEHSRQLPNQAAQAGELRLAAALVRNSIGPFLEGQPPEPLHVVVVGGAGAGKSTVANLLAGTTQAEANPQAGFTRHPVAYAVADNGALPWPVSPGFLGSLERLAEPGPSSVDADVFQIRPVTVDGEFSLLRRFVIWDCPDMTTWAATGYVPRLLEVAGLADVIVYVASDERYNDEVPTQFLRLLLETGKPVIVCLMKMKEADTQALVEHFQREVASRLPPGIVACVPIPLLTPEQLADPVHLASRFRVPLLNQVAVLGEPPTAARLRAVRWATNYLSREQNRLLGVARQDLAALEEWRTIVHAGEAEFDGRYRREYLTSEKYRHFDEALVRLLDLLELPGAGRVISNTLWVLRTPYRLVRGLVVKALVAPADGELAGAAGAGASAHRLAKSLAEGVGSPSQGPPGLGAYQRRLRRRSGGTSPRAFSAGPAPLSKRHGRRGGADGPRHLRGAGEEPHGLEHAARRQADVRPGGDRRRRRHRRRCTGRSISSSCR